MHQSLQKEVEYGRISEWEIQASGTVKRAGRTENRAKDWMQCTQEKKKQSWTGSEKGRNITRIQISLWKWKNGSKWDGNEKKHSWEAKGTTGKKKLT